MLATGRKGDVLDEHHLVVLLRERLLKMGGRVGVKTAENLGVHPRDPIGRLEEPLAVRILTHREENLAHGSLDAVLVDGHDGAPERGRQPVPFYGLAEVVRLAGPVVR